MHRVVHNMKGRKKYLHLMAKGIAAEHSGEGAAMQPISQEDKWTPQEFKIIRGHL